MEIMPTHKMMKECGCFFIGIYSFVGNVVFWHKVGWCKKETCKAGYAFTTKANQEKMAS